MMTLKATVRNGHIRIDEPTSLPEGTVLELEVTGELPGDGRKPFASLRGAFRGDLPDTADFLRRKHEELDLERP